MGISLERKFMKSALIFAILSLASADCAQAAQNVFVRTATSTRKSYSYVCNYLELETAKGLASDAALGNCYEAGFSQCAVTFVNITQNGVIFSRDHVGPGGIFEMGESGCEAKAIVKGIR